MLIELQKKAAQAIVNIFETGKIQGEYGQVTVMRGDTGHLTYGRSQTTLSSGNLYLLIKSYTEAPGAMLAGEFGNYLERLSNQETSLDHEKNLHNILREAGNDPVMHDIQDEFFDRVYWNPSIRSSESIGVESALGVSVVYDSRIHGSWRRMRDRTNDSFGRTKDIGENEWISHYVNTRRDWLANHSNRILNKTVYRMDSFRKLINEENWKLDPPFHVRGMRIDEDSLEGRPIRVSAQDEEERLLRLRSPFMRGDDVRELQEALSNAGLNLDADGIFGPGTEKVVKQFQSDKGLKADGIVGAATRSSLRI